MILAQSDLPLSYVILFYKDIHITIRPYFLHLVPASFYT